VDAAIGRILAALERTRIAGDTLVIFSADHGVAMPRAKCTLYDPGIGIALLVRWPDGGVRPGTVIRELASNVDVLPTLLETIGAPTAKKIQGQTLLARLRGQLAGRDAIFAEKTFHSYYDPMRCIRTERHKLIRNFETGFAVEVPGDIQRGEIFRADPGRYATDRRHVVELYDLEEDPLEQRNLAGTPDVVEVERDLDQRLWSWMEDTDDPLLRGPIPSPRYQLALQGRASLGASPVPRRA
jgi:arylsulfatase A-like enzyme